MVLFLTHHCFWLNPVVSFGSDNSQSRCLTWLDFQLRSEITTWQLIIWLKIKFQSRQTTILKENATNPALDQRWPSGKGQMNAAGPKTQTGDSVVYWPPTRPNMPFQRRRKCIFHWSGRAGLITWDRVKIPRYKLMHRKKVTCELHDSYFRLMTIKHAIPRTAEVTHSDGQLWGDIEGAIELLYNTVKTGSQFSFGDQRI